MKIITHWLMLLTALISLNMSFAQSQNQNVTSENTASCGQVWLSSSVYVANDLVVFENKVYRAQWWTQNNQPTTNNVWEYVEDCAVSVVPQAVITSPQDGTEITIPAGYTVPVNITLNTEVDSVLYAITDVNDANFGNTRTIWVKDAPYTLNMPVIFGKYSIIRAIPHKDGSQGILAQSTVYFTEFVQPNLSATILTPQDNETITLPETTETFPIQIKIDGLNGEIDSVLYVVTDLSERNGFSREYMVTEFPFRSITVPVVFAEATNIHAIPFKNGQAGEADVHRVYFKKQVAVKPTVSFTTTFTQIDYNVDAPETAFITVNASDVDGTVTGVQYKITDGFGTFTYNTLAAPYTMDYTPRIVGDVTVIATAWDNDGQFSLTATTVYTVVEVTSNTCTLPEWNSAFSYSGGAEVQYQGVSYKANWWTTTNPSTNNGPVGTGQPWSITSTCGSSVRTAVANETSVLGVYPNPTTGVFTLAIDVRNPVLVQILNTQGQVVIEKAGVTTSTDFDLSNELAGVYFVKVITANEVLTQQVIVK